jgi:hypothetical protein
MTEKNDKISTPTDPDTVEVFDTADQVDKAVEKALKGGVKTNDDGQIIGVDGKNPVSNVNPNPRAVIGTRPA